MKIFYLNNFLLRIIKATKIAAYVHSLLFEVYKEGILINRYVVVYFPLICSLSKLGVISKVVRNNHCFSHTPYNLAMLQQSRSGPMHIVSVAH